PTTLFLNLCALFLACIATVEGLYIVYRILGHDHHRSSDAWVSFVPVVIMFLINKKTFSYIFVFVYIALLASLAQEIWLIHIGSPINYDGKSLGGAQALVFYIAAISAVFYVLAMAIRYVANAFNLGGE